MRTTYLIFLIIGAIVGSIMCTFSIILDILASDFIFALMDGLFDVEGEKSLIGFTGKAFRNIILIIPLGVFGKKTKNSFLLLIVTLLTFYLGYQNFSRLFIFSGTLIMIGSLFGIVGAFKELLVKKKAKELEEQKIKDLFEQ